jgi:hypothetical protein
LYQRSRDKTFFLSFYTISSLSLAKKWVPPLSPRIAQKSLPFRSTLNKFTPTTTTANYAFAILQ